MEHIQPAKSKEELEIMIQTSAVLRRGLTGRIAFVGIVLVIFISIWSQYAELVIHGTQISLTYPPIGAFLVFFAFIVIVQWPLLYARHLYKKRKQTLPHFLRPFSVPELVILWGMLSLAIGIASIDIAQKMPPMIVGPFYYASDENRYEDLFWPHIASWLAPQEPNVVRGLFESSAHGVPGEAWLGPLLAWTLFFVVAYGVMLCGVVLLQRQWIRHERLLFPLVIVPLQIIEQPPASQIWNQFFRNKLVWLGIALGVLPHIYTGLHDYFPKIPQADIFLWGRRVFQGGLSQPWTPLNNLTIAVLPLIMGLSFLMTREISFSLWAFYLLGKAEAIIGVALGIGGLRTPTGTDTFPFPSLQTAGAYLGLAGATLWIARRELKKAWETIWLARVPRITSMPQAPQAQTNDSSEELSPRFYVWGGALGFGLLTTYCVAAGMPVGPALVMLGFSFIYLLAMTRLVSEAGMPWSHEPEFRGHHWILALFPSGSLHIRHIAATGMMLTFSHDLRVAPMPRFMQSFKMADVTKTSLRDLVAAWGLTLLIALPVSLWALLKAAYTHGGVAINVYRFVTLARQPGLFMEKALHTSHPTVDWATLGVIGYGAAKLLALNWLRTTYLWWPLHPVGYAMSFVVYLHREWLSVLIGWALQTIIIRYGGHRGYQAARPLFLGLILGAMIAGGFWLVLDGFTGLRDHKILY